MSELESAISPRGIPPIRTDWVADVAWRLGALGIDYLRALPCDHLTLTDVVDGETWRVEPLQISDPWQAQVELDADLYLPTDHGAATMRAGFAYTPVWDDDGGRMLEIRVEVGPRGAVTFDPENWMFRVPEQQVTGAGRPTIKGVQAGTWRPVAEDVAFRFGPAELADLAGTTLLLHDLVEVANGHRSWTTVIGATHAAPRGGVLRRVFDRVKNADPFGRITVEADGELRVTPLGPIRAEGFSDRQQVDDVLVETGRLILRGPSIAAALGGGHEQLVVEGPGLTVVVDQLTREPGEAVFPNPA